MMNKKKLFKKDFGNLTRKEIVLYFLSAYDEYSVPFYFPKREACKLAKRIYEKEQISRERYKEIKQMIKKVYKSWWDYEKTKKT